MAIFLLALVGALIVMGILTIGRLGFGRREKFDSRRFLRWFIGYFIFNYLFCLVVLSFPAPALAGHFWGWRWFLWPFFFSIFGTLSAFARRAVGVLEEAAAASRGHR